MKGYSPLLVTARLATPLAGNAPRLDAVLESVMSLYHAKGIPGHKITRDGPAPPLGALPISMARETLGPWPVAKCSDPILGITRAETVEHVTKKLGVDKADLLRESARLVVSTTNSWTKSYRIPLRVRVVDRVRWFAVGDRRAILKILRRVGSIGKKISVGYGRVAEWTVDRMDDDWSWFAPSDGGPVLMATLPFGPWLPEGLVGVRRDFRSCCPPYWHLSRLTEVVVPC
jgi:hypothetical protein